MLSHPDGSHVPSGIDQIRLARDVLRQEGEALISLSQRLGNAFSEAVQRLAAAPGMVIVIGMGKAGLVGQKTAATLASTGTRSLFLHPAEALHGDLGRIEPADVVLAMSFSGETEEITKLLPSIRRMQVPLVAVTGNPASKLAAAADVTIDLGHITEACPLGLAPTTSTTAMIGVGDALAIVLSQMKQFQREDFFRLHPAGSLGQRLARVDDLMRPLSDCRVADQSCSVREVLIHVSRPGRRTGAIMLVGEKRKLTGLFTDSDLAKLLENRQDAALDRCVAEVMSRDPSSMTSGDPMSDAIELLAERKISELPIVNSHREPIGLIDVTDVVGLLPREQEVVEKDGHAPTIRLLTGN